MSDNLLNCQENLLSDSPSTQEGEQLPGPQPDYKKLYFSLFNAATDALEHIKSKNYGLACECLRRAQQATENMYIGDDTQ